MSLIFKLQDALTRIRELEARVKELEGKLQERKSTNAGWNAYYALKDELATLRKGEPVARIVKNEAGQIRIVNADGSSFDMSKHIGADFYLAPVIPDGMVLVPKEPTKEIVAAMTKELPNDQDTFGAAWLVREQYKAMIAAAQGEKDAPKD